MPDGVHPERGAINIGKLTIASHNHAGFRPHVPINVDMMTIYNFLGDFLHRGPSDLLDRCSGIIILLLGTGILALMAYAILTAWS
jgi:hypothetical protein